MDAKEYEELRVLALGNLNDQKRECLRKLQAAISKFDGTMSIPNHTLEVMAQMIAWDADTRAVWQNFLIVEDQLSMIPNGPED